MAGIFFEVFLLISSMATVITIFAFWKQKLEALPFGVILFALAGALLLSQGLQYESGGVFDQASGVITYSFSTVTASDPSVLMIGITFVVMSIVLGIMFFKRLVQGGES